MDSNKRFHEGIVRKRVKGASCVAQCCRELNELSVKQTSLIFRRLELVRWGCERKSDYKETNLDTSKQHDILSIPTSWHSSKQEQNHQRELHCALNSQRWNVVGKKPSEFVRDSDHLIVNCKLIWTDHAMTVTNAYTSKVNLLRRSQFLPTKQHQEFYLKLILPSVLYGQMVWGSCNKTCLIALKSYILGLGV